MRVLFGFKTHDHHCLYPQTYMTCFAKVFAPAEQYLLPKNRKALWLTKLLPINYWCKWKNYQKMKDNKIDFVSLQIVQHQKENISS